MDSTDFVVTGTTATITAIVPVGTGNNIYDISVGGGNLPGLAGTVGLNLSASQNIKDLTNAALPNTEPPIDEVYTINNTAVSGTVFNDLNSDGVRDVGESGIAGRSVYIDVNNNSTLDTASGGPLPLLLRVPAVFPI